MTKHSQHLLAIGLVLSLSIGCDQTTKRIAELTLQGNYYSFVFDTFRLQFIKNAGAFLGFGSQFSDTVKLWLFIVLPVVFLLAAMIYLFLSRLSLIHKIMLSLVVSGGIGNLIDRILLDGKVTDFMNMGIGSIRTGIFNIADVSIMIGAFGLLWLELRKPKTDKK